MPLQKPVPRSNQSLFLSSYTLTRLRSFAGGGATNAIVGSRAYKHSGQGKQALQSEARDRDPLRKYGLAIGRCTETSMEVGWLRAGGDKSIGRIGGWAAGLCQRDVVARATAPVAQRSERRCSRDERWAKLVIAAVLRRLVASWVGVRAC
jgi:hypothetical protein